MKVSEVLNKEEIAYFSRKSDWRGLGVILNTWASILILFFIVSTWTNAFTIIALLLLLPGRMLALAVISHDCGHKVLFKSEKLNFIVGQYFSANLVFTDLTDYATSHRQHHKLAGTDQDPDLPNYQHYPVEKSSFKRKIIRDITGQTGYKLLHYVISSALQYRHKERREFAWPFVKELFIQGVFAVFVSLAFTPALYLIWLATFFTSYMIIVRLRQLAEHASVPNLYDPDPRQNTRTVIARWWEKLVLAPNNVNFHVEHHFMASVPCYRLAEFHQHLQDKGVYKNTVISEGYPSLLKQLITP